MATPQRLRNHACGGARAVLIAAEEGPGAIAVAHRPMPSISAYIWSGFVIGARMGVL